MRFLKYKTIEECLNVAPQVWDDHVEAFRDRAREQMRLALSTDRERKAEHWRLMAHIVELDPRDWDGYGLLDRWEGRYDGEPGDCSSGCVYFRPLSGDLAADWGVCTNPWSHRKGKLTFEHQGCFAFQADYEEGRES